MSRHKLFVSCFSVWVMLGGSYTSAENILVEDVMFSVGNGGYTNSTNGLISESGSSFYGYSSGVIQGFRAGATYVRFSDLGLGAALQPGVYKLVMRVASTGMQDWPGLRDMTILDSGSGYACGFFTTVGFGTSLAIAGRATLNNMVDFNNTPGISYAADSSFLSASNPLPLGDSGMLEDTWYSVTSTWTIAEGSSIVGTDPFVGLGFEVGNGSGGAIYIDDSSLTYVSADTMYADWATNFPSMGTNTALTANADGDALNNLCEYAFGGDPSDSGDAGYVPTIGTVEAGGTNWFQFTSAKRKDADIRGLSYSVEQNTNLVSGIWTNGDCGITGTDILSSTFDQDTYRISTDTADTLFVRVLVTFAPFVADFFVPKTQKSIARILGEYPELSSMMGSRWYYNWSRVPGTNAPPNLEFVPMIWGTSTNSDGSIDVDKLRSRIQEALVNAPGCKNLLAFNEPSNTNQSDLSVEQVLGAWPVFEQELAGRNIRLGSPGVVGIGSSWLTDFMAGASNLNYRVDFLCVHRRVDFESDPVNTLLTECQALYAQYHKPIWITELELTGAGITEADVIRIWQDWADRLENDPLVQGIIERYAFAYAPPDTTTDYKIVARPYETNGTLTAFGRVFQRLHESASP